MLVDPARAGARRGARARARLLQRRGGRSTTTSSSSPGTSRAPRAVRSSGASCTSASAARARSRSGSPVRAASSPASSIPTPCSISAPGSRSSSSRPTARRCACWRATRSSYALPPGPGRRWPSERARLDRLARRRHRPDAVDTIDPRRALRSANGRGATPMLAGGLRGLPRRADRRSRTGRRRGSSRSYDDASARLARGGGGGVADARGDRGSRARERRALPGGQQRAAAERGDPRERRRRDRRGRPRRQGRALEPRGRAGSRASRRPRRFGRTPAEALGRSLDSDDTAGRQPARADPARRARRSGCRSARR